MEWRIQVEKIHVQIMENKIENINSGQIVPDLEYRQQANKNFSSVLLGPIAGL